jgi:magnesium transporter
MPYIPATLEFKCGAMELPDEWQSRQNTPLWADFWGEEPGQEQHILIECFGLHPVAIQDAQRQRHPPKLEAFDDHAFILFKGLGRETPDSAFDTIQIALCVGKRFLVTRHSDSSPGIDRLWQEPESDQSLFARGACLGSSSIAI